VSGTPDGVREANIRKTGYPSHRSRRLVYLMATSSISGSVLREDKGPCLAFLLKALSKAEKFQNRPCRSPHKGEERRERTVADGDL